MNRARRGGVLVLVLILGVVVTVLGTGGLLLRQRTLELVEVRDDGSAARLLARSAADLALEAIEEGAEVSTFPAGFAFVDTALGGATLQSWLTAPADRGTATVRSEAAIGDARALLDVDVVFATAYRERALALGPVLYWPLDERAGAEFDGVRELVRGHSGAYSGLFGICGDATGPDGGAAPGFDSTFASAGISSHPDMEVVELTIACWVWLADGRSGTRVMLSKDDRDAGDGEFTVYVHDGRVLARVETASQSATIGGTGLSAGVWAHVALSVDGTGAALYVDGALAGETSAFNPQAQKNEEPLLIGVTSAVSGVYSDPLYGSVRDVAVFDQSFDADEVAELYGSGWTVPLSPPRAVAGSWRWAVD